MPPISPSAAARPPQAIILYSRASFFKKHAIPALHAALLQAYPGALLREAFEDQAAPALPEVLDELYDLGLREVTILPCGLPPDLALMHWLPGALRAHLAGREDFQVTISRPLEDFLDHAAAASQALAARPACDIAEARPSMGKPGWTDVPAHRHQLFFCLGARCAHRGAHGLLHKLRRALRDQRALTTQETRVMVVRSSCLFPCNQGPVMVLHPEGTWYGGLTEERIERIVTQHLLAGKPVTEATIHRADRPQSND